MSIFELLYNFSTETTSDLTRYEIKEKNDQYFTPIEVTKFMASMVKEIKKNEVNILDPGCGIGNLSVTLIMQILKWKNTPKVINLYVYEIDETLSSKLKHILSKLQLFCEERAIKLNYKIFFLDFILESLENNLELKSKFDFIIMNPPYRKMNSDSIHNRYLLSYGIDVPNYYAAFISISKQFLKQKGQMVCLIPRSFCSGVYFKSFRQNLIEDIKIHHIHIFRSRKDIFYDDVQQETIIFSFFKDIQKLNDKILITESSKSDFSDITQTYKRFDNVIFPHDSQKIIRIIHTADKDIVDKMHRIPCRLEDLKINISTGPIVHFRENPDSLLFESEDISYPMIYPEHFKKGMIKWPLKMSKPNFINEDEKNKKRLRPSGIYVLVKRMTTKEEKKRIVAAIFDNTNYPNQKVGFDNKVNYYHINKHGLESLDFARGLCAYLNSSIVDFYFRTFSGSTQVNVTDLKLLKYPSKADLIRLGKKSKNINKQEDIDSIINQYLETIH
ncbi:HsdM family class I SAM-dependent methyltransferase [Lysinibacillus fusiformis]|uniref:HsdM family class I SAM-dependent methyltransferase n=1 Tax=Lysinibacillus fusiformis TaxID=28031 RepID=UPI003D01DC80